LASRRDRPSRVSTEPQPAPVTARPPQPESSGAARDGREAFPSASRGPDDPSATAPMAPLEEEREAAGAEPTTETAAPGPAARHVSVRNPTRRLKQRLKRIAPLSVIKLSLFYYLIFLAVWLGIVAVLYSLIDGLGLFDLIHNVGKGLEIGALKKLDVSLGVVEKWAFIVGLVMVLLGSIVNGFLALLYNLGADLTGGLEVTIVERETYRR
jgi:Transmembrane domain of unknown function (DUF3566)